MPSSVGLVSLHSTEEKPQLSLAVAGMAVTVPAIRFPDHEARCTNDQKQSGKFRGANCALTVTWENGPTAEDGRKRHDHIASL